MPLSLFNVNHFTIVLQYLFAIITDKIGLVSRAVIDKKCCVLFCAIFIRFQVMKTEQVVIVFIFLIVVSKNQIAREKKPCSLGWERYIALLTWRGFPATT
ncbi:hypothetical protein HA44_03615 [Mixta gaviniae]|nr:hypothetical protein HA44_03615 [Mixta gaviniae]